MIVIDHISIAVAALRDELTDIDRQRAALTLKAERIAKVIDSLSTLSIGTTTDASSTAGEHCAIPDLVGAERRRERDRIRKARQRQRERAKQTEQVEAGNDGSRALRYSVDDCVAILTAIG